jgi:hypothetical protein
VDVLDVVVTVDVTATLEVVVTTLEVVVTTLEVVTTLDEVVDGSVADVVVGVLVDVEVGGGAVVDDVVVEAVVVVVPESAFAYHAPMSAPTYPRALVMKCPT